MTETLTVDKNVELTVLPIKDEFVTFGDVVKLETSPVATEKIVFGEKQFALTDRSTESPAPTDFEEGLFEKEFVVINSHTHVMPFATIKRETSVTGGEVGASFATAISINTTMNSCTAVELDKTGNAIKPDGIVIRFSQASAQQPSCDTYQKPYIPDDTASVRKVGRFTVLLGHRKNG